MRPWAWWRFEAQCERPRGSARAEAWWLAERGLLERFEAADLIAQASVREHDDELARLAEAIRPSRRRTA